MKLKPYYKPVLNLLDDDHCNAILDVPCGKGWLACLLDDTKTIDGADASDFAANKYRKFFKIDFNESLPLEDRSYDAVVSCEGLEHMGNPLLFLKECRRILRIGGQLIVTTPNIWYPGARCKFLINGFFPSFPAITSEFEVMNHKHLIPWSPPQLYLFLKLAGFSEIEQFAREEQSPKRRWERALVWILKGYVARRYNRAKTDDERQFWETMKVNQGLAGRGLIFKAIA